MAEKIVTIVGVGIIGEPLVGLATDFKNLLGADEVIFTKKTPASKDAVKVRRLKERGALFAVEEDLMNDFRRVGMPADLTIDEALHRSTVIIDCTNEGIENKKKNYMRLKDRAKLIAAQGSEEGFGLPYARIASDGSPGLAEYDDIFFQIMSCNAHNILALYRLAKGEGNTSVIKKARFVLVRRANDIGETKKFIPSPEVGKHKYGRRGSHQAHDAWRLLKTNCNVDVDLFSSEAKSNSQYMHVIHFNFEFNNGGITKEEFIRRIYADHLVAPTFKTSTTEVFGFGRNQGYFGRILNQTVIPIDSIDVTENEVIGFCFTPQDGNSLLSSFSAIAKGFHPIRYLDIMKEVEEMTNPRLVFDEV